MTSRVNGPIEKPSAAMWCTTKTSACSVGDTANNAARNGMSAVRSKPAPVNAATRSRRSSAATVSTGSSSPISAAGRTTWYPTPSTAGKTVRSDSWRSTTSATAARRAGTSRAPVNRIATGMLFTVESGSNRFRNHIRCCASDSGIRSGRGPAVSSLRTGPAESARIRAASASTVEASNTARTGIWARPAADRRATTCVAISELPPSSKKSSSRPT
ncbi:hypothetical protein Br6_05241 [Rhodococcus sp. Br-6]|nr:hypothetical protein Br6_05241 [Rhodococcus sp. Br-6]